MLVATCLLLVLQGVITSERLTDAVLGGHSAAGAVRTRWMISNARR
jgi:hypothetical protein